jgi:hypothetical protein
MQPYAMHTDDFIVRLIEKVILRIFYLKYVFKLVCILCSSNTNKRSDGFFEWFETY